MVLTCEPGVYIREEAIGIRIENDILITDKGCVDLTESIPREADEIEKLMNQSKKGINSHRHTQTHTNRHRG
jgi:Xaa-Pro aminopeptidase